MVGLDDLLLFFFFIVSHPVAPAVRVPAEPHVLIYNTDPLSLPRRTRAGEVGNVVFGRVDDPVLLVQIDHRRLNIGMPQHGLNLSDGRPMLERERRGCMAQRMGRNRAEGLRLGVHEPMEARLLQMVPHHGLNGPDAQGPAAATLGHIVRLGVILPRPPQPTEERVFRKEATERLSRTAARMMPLVMQLKVGREGLEHPGSQHHRLFGRVAALPMEIEDRVAVPLGEMSALRPREFNAPGAGTDPEQRHGIVSPAPLLSRLISPRQLEGVHEPGDFGFRQTIPHEPLGDFEALHLPHGMIRNLAGLLQPGTKGPQAREVGIDRPRGQPGPGPLPLGLGEKRPVALQELFAKTVLFPSLFAGLAPPAKKVGETAAIEELRARGGIAGAEGGDHRGQKVLEGGTLDRDPLGPGQHREGVNMDLAAGRRAPGCQGLGDGARVARSVLDRLRRWVVRRQLALQIRPHE